MTCNSRSPQSLDGRAKKAKAINLGLRKITGRSHLTPAIKRRGNSNTHSNRAQSLASSIPEHVLLSLPLHKFEVPAPNGSPWARASQRFFPLRNNCDGISCVPSPRCTRLRCCSCPALPSLPFLSLNCLLPRSCDLETVDIAVCRDSTRREGISFPGTIRV